MGEAKEKAASKPRGRMSPSKLSIYNRALIEKSAVCGCFYCLKTFPATAIKKWVDEPEKVLGKKGEQTGLTAICPFCGIDSVVGFETDSKLNLEKLELWNRTQFGGSSVKKRKRK